MLITIGETNRVLDEITIVEKQTVEYVANSQTSVGVQAQSVLAELNQSNYIRFPQQIPPINSGMIVNEGENVQLITSSVKQNIAVYPNPSEGSIMIHFDEGNNGVINIIDMSGKTIVSFIINSSQLDYGINDLPFGIYNIVTFYDDGLTETERVMVK